MAKLKPVKPPKKGTLSPASASKIRAKANKMMGSSAGAAY